MRYPGSKQKIGKWLSEQVGPFASGRRLVEPFCGGLGATMHLRPTVAADLDRDLIQLYLAVRDGWLPPVDLISRELYAAKCGDGALLGTFLRHGASFGGKPCGGYAAPDPEPPRHYVLEAAGLLWKKIARTRETELLCADYREIPYQRGDVVYCDPPYRGTVGYQVNETAEFDHREFWEWARSLANTRNCTVLVSEYSAPDWALEIATKPRKSTLRSSDLGGQDSLERLFLVSP